MADERTMARRAAVVAISEAAARSAIERIVDEAMKAANVFGLTRERANGYAAGINGTLPLAFEAIGMADGPERSARIRALAVAVRGVSESNRIPRLVERGLVAIGVRIGREVVRRGAETRGFTPDELEQELVSFTDQLEDRLFSDDVAR